MAEESLRRWVRQHEIDAGQREGLTTDEREELSRLRRENRTLEQERELMKKAAPSSSRWRKGLGELLLRAHRGGEDELPRPTDVPHARGFQERLLRLERQALFGEGPRGWRPYRNDPRDPPTRP
jgi:hypothetical protein